MVVEYLGMGRGKPSGIGDFFQGCGSGSASLWIKYVGDEPPHGLGPGLFLSKSGKVDHREAAQAASVRKLGVPPLGGGDVGGEVVGCGGVHLEEAEYGITVHYHLASSGLL